MNKLRGILLCLCIAIVAYYLGGLLPVIGGPVFGIVLGICIGGYVRDNESFKVGIGFTSKKILQLAVILLGFGLNMQLVISVGKTSLPIICATIATSLILAFIISKALKISPKIATLIGVGSSICGGSAIAATAPVIDADDDEIAQAISVIFLFNVVAAIIFPSLGDLIGLSNEGFSIFAGTAVNDTSSVTAAASAWDSIHGTGTQVLDSATVVKLTRTLAIIPITLCLAIYNTIKKEESGKEGNKKIRVKNIFPMFILYFILASLFTTGVDYMISNSFISSALGESITRVFHFLKALSKFFIIMSMSAIGINTHIKKLITTGGKPLCLGFTLWFAISVVSLAMQKLMLIY